MDDSKYCRKLQTQKVRREALKREHKCIVCASQLPDGCSHLLCFGCRIKHADNCRRYRQKKVKDDERTN